MQNSWKIENENVSLPYQNLKYKAIVTIEEGIVKGSIPRRALTLVYEWLDLHKRELMENWELLREFKSPNKIKPLE